MARCRKCGKSGLFFKVNSEGYCEYCAQQLRDEEIVRHNQEHKRQMAMAAAAAGVKPAEPVSDLKYTLGLIGSSTSHCTQIAFRLISARRVKPFRYLRF